MSEPKFIELYKTLSVREYTLKEEEIALTADRSVRKYGPGIRIPKCYLCGSRQNKIHWFYHSICAACGDVAYEKRRFKRDLTGYRALVTGGRLKLGYQIVLKLLRAGAEVMVTSRDWVSAIERYETEPDYQDWKYRLYVARITFDLTIIDTLLVDLDAELDRVWPDKRLDILIHNAAQTISGINSDVVSELEVPEGFQEVDRYGRKIDRRDQNTWSAPFGSVDPNEVKEVLLANAWAPFVLNQFLLSRLNNRPADRLPHAYIIHVHAKEGHFSSHKTLNHTHTNIAKAALSMLTRCIATNGISCNVHTFMTQYRQEYLQQHKIPWITESIISDTIENKDDPVIRMHGVDPGWFSIDEYTLKSRIEQNIYYPPVDEIDAAARVLYPIMIEAKSYPGTWKHYVPIVRF